MIATPITHIKTSRHDDMIATPITSRHMTDDTSRECLDDVDETSRHMTDDRSSLSSVVCLDVSLS